MCFISRSLRHANIFLPYFKQESECDKAMLLATEPAELGNLYHVINKTVEKISSAARLSIVKDIANGCNFLHKNSIIHNYLNSKSIYISYNWKVKIGNFEFSSKTTGTVDVKPTFDVKSSYHISYAAPEAINQREFSYVTDIYRWVFIVLFVDFLLVGRHQIHINIVKSHIPRAGDREMAIIMSIYFPTADVTETIITRIPIYQKHLSRGVL